MNRPLRRATGLPVLAFLLQIALCIGSMDRHAIGQLPAPCPGPAGLLLLEDGNPAVSRRLQESFRPDTPELWADGWRRLSRLGPSGGPLLISLWQRESNVKRRHVLLLGQAACGHPGLEDWLFHEPPRSPSNDERFLALLAIALGPRRTGSASAVASLVQARDASHILQVSGGLALERFHERPTLPEAWLRSDDPGVVAVTCYLQDTPATFNLPRPRGGGDGGRSLVMRAWFSADIGRSDDMRRAQLAATVLRDTPPPPLRDAATLLLSRVHSTTQSIAPPDPLPADAVTIFALAPHGRRTAIERGWLTADPAARLPDLERNRQTVQFCIGASEAALSQAAPRLAADRNRAGAAALALAWRRLRGDRAVTATMAAAFSAVPEGIWLAAATGRPPELVSGQLGDVAAESSYRFFAEGRVSTMDAAIAVETMLWRRREHPGLAGAEMRRLLVRDLLLAGSEAGRARYGSVDPYLPSGQDPNAMCFTAAIEYFAYLQGTLIDLPEFRLLP